MTSQSKTLEEEWAIIQDQLGQRDFKVYPGVLISLQNIAPWPDDHSIDEFLDFAETCERRIIYTDAQKFDVEDSLELLLLATDLDLPFYELDKPLDWLEFTGLYETEEGQDYIRRAGVHYGDLFRFSVHWMLDGVNHSYRRRAAWHEDMEIQAGRLIEMAEAGIE